MIAHENDKISRPTQGQLDLLKGYMTNVTVMLGLLTGVIVGGH